MPFLLAVNACAPRLPTDNGELLVVAEDVSTLGDPATGPAPMLVGTVTCPTYTCLGASCPPTAQEALDCFDLAGARATYDPGSGCWSFDQVGVATWHFVAGDCAANEAGYLPGNDQVSFSVVAEPDIAVQLFTFEESGLFPTPWPPGWLPALGQPWRLVIGEPFRFFPDLRLLADPTVRVGYTLGSIGGRAVALRPPLVQSAFDAVEVRYVAADDPAMIVASVGSFEVPLVSVAPVDGAEAASITVVPAWLKDSEGNLTPAGARAVVRDAAGEPMFGAPVTWSLDDGLLLVARSDEFPVPGADYVVLLDQCVDPKENLGDHTAIVRATLGGLTTTTELRWTVSSAEESDARTTEPWRPDPRCEQGEPPPPPPPPDTGGETDPQDTDTSLAARPTPERATELWLSGGHCGCATGAGGGRAHPRRAAAGAATFALLGLGFTGLRRKSSR